MMWRYAWIHPLNELILFQPLIKSILVGSKKKKNTDLFYTQNKFLMNKKKIVQVLFQC